MYYQFAYERDYKVHYLLTSCLGLSLQSWASDKFLLRKRQKLAVISEPQYIVLIINELIRNLNDSFSTITHLKYALSV